MDDNKKKEVHGMHPNRGKEAYYNRQWPVLEQIYRDGLQECVSGGGMKREKNHTPTIRCMDGRLQKVWGPCVAGSLIGQPKRVIGSFLESTNCSLICSHDDCGAGKKLFQERYSYPPDPQELKDFVQDETSKVAEEWRLQYTRHISAEEMIAPGLGHIEVAVTYLGVDDVSFDRFPRSLIIHRNHLPRREVVEQAIFACKIILSSMGAWISPKRPVLLAGICDSQNPAQSEQFYDELLMVADSFSEPLVRVDMAFI